MSEKPTEPMDPFTAALYVQGEAKKMGIEISAEKALQMVLTKWSEDRAKGV